MSKDDLLARAAAALRASTDSRSGSGADVPRGADAQAARTRANVLLVASARTRRRKVVALVWPLAAALILSTAWAGTHGASARWARVGRLFEPSQETRATSGAAAAVTGAAPASTPVAPVASGAPVAPGAPVDVSPPADAARHVAANSPRISAETPSTRVRAHAAPETPDARVASNVAPSDARATSLYAVAHRAHFVDGDPAAALVAWDAYLAAAPDGALAPEARYNRGIALVRLGRYDDARRALAPFAAQTGGYRAREAKRLIDAIDAR